MQIIKSPKIYDVAIIGSGAAGGMTGYVLSKAGLDVAMLEAGPLRNLSELPNHRLKRWDLPFRGIRGDYFREWYQATNFLLDDRQEPYSWEGNDPVPWVRIRAVGGKTLFWAAHTPRLGPDNFQPKDDFDTGWPITYGEIAPYYDRVEEMIGVTSTVESIGSFPLNNGLPPLEPKCAEIEIKRAAEKIGRGLKVLPLPKAILTVNYKGRPACHWCGPCSRGCDSGSKFDSLRVFVLAARRTGRLTLLVNARVRSLSLGRNGKVASAHYYDTKDRRYREVRARAFVLAAGCIESAQILLNSGIANSSGLVGHYLSEHISAIGVSGFLPQLLGREVTNEDGSGMHTFIPDLTANWRGNKFIRGYQIYPSGQIPEFTLVGRQIPGFGVEWQKRIREYYTAGVSVYCQGEVLPYRNNHIEVDDKLKDDAGIPGVRFHYSWRDNERAMIEDMLEVCEEILRAAGAEYFPNRGSRRTYGRSIHWLGTTRMGRDPKASVLNPWNQSHDIPNLFVNDSAAFVTAGSSNPTLTILALALRSSEHMVEMMRQGEI